MIDDITIVVAYLSIEEGNRINLVNQQPGNILPVSPPSGAPDLHQAQQFSLKQIK